MGETSASVNGAGPVKENRLSRLLPPGEPASTPGGDPTIDFRAVDPAHKSAAGGTPPPARSEYSFLGSPRDGDELGWLAHYRVRRLIGSGGMGLVFLAEDTQLLRPVALKVIRPELASSPEAAARFVREARSAAAIKHDHIVTVYQVGEAQGVAFLAMEYLQGISLQHWLERGRTASIDQVLRIGREVASGLAAAHRSGLVHRDIKPANIWLERRRPGQDPRLRSGAGRARRRPDHSGRYDHGHPRVHVARTGRGLPGRPGIRLVQPRLRPLPTLQRPAPLPGQDDSVRAHRSRVPDTRATSRAQAGDAGRAQRPGDATAGKIAGGPPRVGTGCRR